MTRLAPYFDQHQESTLQGPGDSRPTAVQIVQDQGLVDSPSWAGRVVLVTGCSPGGLGPETAKAMHLTGADVYITSRDASKGRKVADEILADGKSGKVEVIAMDLNSLKSVKVGAEEFLRKSGNKLNILVNNAGVMFCPEGRTENGFETHMAANHFGHFYLFHQVKNALIGSSTPDFKSRVVQVSSGAHRYGQIDLEDLNHEKKEYDSKAAYGQAKLANIHFANELDRRYQSTGLRALSLHPGGIITPLTRFMEPFEVDPKTHMGKTMKTPAQGAATAVWGAVAKELEDKGGLYLDEVSVAELVLDDHTYYMGGYAARAFDPSTEKALWEQSLRLTGVRED